jgi:hypothetical protein
VNDSTVKMYLYLLLTGFFVGALLSAIGLFLYDKTIIHWAILLVLWIVPGLAALPISCYVLNEPNKKADNLLLFAFFNCVSLGGIVFFLFLGLNRIFASHDSILIKCDVISQGYHSRHRRFSRTKEIPFVDLEIKGYIKQLELPVGTDLSNATEAYVTISNGLFGFYVINNYGLIRKR